MAFVARLCVCLVLTLALCSSALAADTIKIASIFAKSGPASAANLHHIQAVRFAAEEINAEGGVLGKQIEIVEFDNHSTPIQSKIAAKKAIQAGVVAVLGASWSDHSIAMAPVFQKKGIPMLSPDSTNPKVTKKGDYIFRACFIDPFQGEVLAKFVQQEFSAKTAVVMADIGSAYSLGLGEMFKKHFEQGKGRILGEFEYKMEQRDFSDALARIKELNPDVLCIPGHDESGRIVKQAQEMGITAKMVGGDGWGYWAFMSNGGKEMKVGYYTTHWSKEVDTPESKEFVKKYQQAYELNDFAAVAYDATWLLAKAIERAGSTDPKAIRDALAATKNYKGVTGSITLNDQGDPLKPAVIIKIENGKTSYYKTVSP